MRWWVLVHFGPLETTCYLVVDEHNQVAKVQVETLVTYLANPPIFPSLSLPTYLSKYHR
jgi:hypothetical protein